MNTRGFVYFVGVMIVLFLMTPANVSADCYKYLTLKNEGAYYANASVNYKWVGYNLDKWTGHFSRGHEKRVAIPCAATAVTLWAEVVRGSVIIHRYELYNAEDRCFLFKGTSHDPHFESCDPPGTPPVFTVDCWKHVTIKHEGAYVANASAEYTIRGERGAAFRIVKTGDFYHGDVKRLPIPCSSSGAKMSVHVSPKLDNFLFKELEKNRDYCFIVKGTHASPRYETCAVAGEQMHTVTLRNHGAYATELWVTYDFQGERPTHKSTIQTQQTGGTTIPLQATKVHVKAKAVAGETIFSKDYPTAQNLCYEVRGTTLITRWTYCSP
jgi:hypothetical protein